MGGFHVILSLQRTIYFCFKDSVALLNYYLRQLLERKEQFDLLFEEGTLNAVFAITRFYMKHFYNLKYNSLKLLLQSQLNLKTRLILYVTILTMKTVKYYLKNTWMKYQYQQYPVTCQSGCSLQ